MTLTQQSQCYTIMKNIGRYPGISIVRGEVVVTRYFVINARTNILHIYGCCRQTKPRSVPIRLFDSPKEAESYAGRPLVLCKHCLKNRKK